jgi:hypothetical protein
MEDNGRIARAAAFSPRVKDLFGVAMRLAARVRLSIELPESRARELAVFGAIPAALERLKDRLSVHRSIPGGETDRAAQARLAAFELVAEAAGGAQREIIMRGIEVERRAAAAGSRTAQNIRSIEELAGELRASSPDQREFIRRADRLRARQINHLRSAIYESEILARVIERLDQVYGRYLSAALKS